MSLNEITQAILAYLRSIWNYPIDWPTVGDTALTFGIGIVCIFVVVVGGSIIVLFLQRLTDRFHAWRENRAHAAPPQA